MTANRPPADPPPPPPPPPPPEAPRLRHLTLNTGHLVATARAEVAGAALAALRPAVAAEGGPVPGLEGWFLDVLRLFDADGRPVPGVAFFQVADEPGLSRRPALMGVAAWRGGAAARRAWAEATGAYAALRGPLAAAGMWREPPRAPPSATPWLAVWLTPFVALADAVDARAFGDLGRCVAWALIEEGDNRGGPPPRAGEGA